VDQAGVEIDADVRGHDQVAPALLLPLAFLVCGEVVLRSLKQVDELPA
jgi:hypothetical protein